MQRRDVQQMISRALAVAALTLVSTTAAAQVPSTAAAAPQLASIQATDDISKFYNASKNSPIWFRSGQAEAAPMLVNILKRSEIEGFARGPQLAAEVEAAIFVLLLFPFGCRAGVLVVAVFLLVLLLHFVFLFFFFVLLFLRSLQLPAALPLPPPSR